MKKKCILCGIFVDEEENFCEVCLAVLREKYPKKKELEKILRWHQNHTELNQEC
jgi:hypothetical protein